MTRRRTRTVADTTAWADLLDITARHVRSGLSLPAAFHLALQTHPIDGAAIHPDARFHDVVGATTPDPDEATVVHSLAVTHALGGHVSAGLQAGTSVLRERAAVRADIAVHSAQARISARVLTAVPIVFSSWGVLFSRSFRGAVASPAGVVAVVVGVALNTIGWWWMRCIIAGIQR